MPLPRLLPVLLALPLLAAPPQARYQPRKDLEAGYYLKTLSEADSRLQGNPKDGLALAARSQALTALVRLPEALDAAEKALAASPGLPDALLARGLARAGLAVQQRNLGSIKGIARAMEDLEAAASADPTLTAAWAALALGYQELPGILGGSTRKALACADRLRAVDPARGWAVRGTVLSLDGRWGQAEQAFQSALKAGPGHPDALIAYLEALGSRETRKALGPDLQRRRLLEEARRLRPAAQERSRVLAAIADALLDADQPEEAWALLKGVPDGGDAPSLVRLQFGKVAARSGLHREEGLAMLERALEGAIEGGSGGPAAAHGRRAQILAALGRNTQAREAAQSALRLNPGDRRAQEVLKGLD